MARKSAKYSLADLRKRKQLYWESLRYNTGYIENYNKHKDRIDALLGIVLNGYKIRNFIDPNLQFNEMIEQSITLHSLSFKIPGHDYHFPLDKSSLGVVALVKKKQLCELNRSDLLEGEGNLNVLIDVDLPTNLIESAVRTFLSEISPIVKRQTATKRVNSDDRLLDWAVWLKYNLSGVRDFSRIGREVYRDVSIKDYARKARRAHRRCHEIVYGQKYSESKKPLITKSQLPVRCDGCADKNKCVDHYLKYKNPFRKECRDFINQNYIKKTREKLMDSAEYLDNYPL